MSAIIKLFKIVGEKGPELTRVKEAMDWLLSPKAKGIGQKLLQDAHKLHEKPLTIKVSKLSSGYEDLLGQHTVLINPRQVESFVVTGANGKSGVMSVERALAHEMKHATQKGAAEQTANKSLLEAKIKGDAESHLTMRQREALHDDMFKAQDASYFETARAHLAKYIDKVAIPMQEKVDHLLSAHPEYKKFMKKIEMPAVKVENRVATLRGEPIRADYESSHKIAPEKLRDLAVEELSSILELERKPHLPLALPKDVAPLTAPKGTKPGRG